MLPAARVLLNAADVELWPAWLLRARSNADARQLHRARWCMRRKSDGHFLATWEASTWRSLRRGSLPASLLQQIRDWQPLLHCADLQPRLVQRTLPMQALAGHLARLGLDAAHYARDSGLAAVAEPNYLCLAGFDRYRRPLWLAPRTAHAWQAMREAARADGVPMDAISGYRSHAYQLGIVTRKLARGQPLAGILTVNAAPGFSEHHSGRAVDIGMPGTPPAETAFEATPAFVWLSRHAARFGFFMSYPRENPHGILYEPWHWCWHPPSGD